MAARRESQGLQIALIIFVLLTIVLAVTTFLFYKEYEEAELARMDDQKDRQDADMKWKKAEEEMKLFRKFLGRGSADTINAIQEDFDLHMQTHQATFQEELNDYPTALDRLRDANKKLQQEKLGLQVQITSVETAKKVVEASAQKEKATFDSELARISNDITGQIEQFTKDRSDFDVKLRDYEEQLGDKGKALIAIKDKKDNKIRLLDQKNARSKAKLEDATSELAKTRDLTLEEPDGHITGINHRERTVYINLGRRDGLRRLITFSVFDRDANPHQKLDDETVKKLRKATIEVTRILGDHRAEARITLDTTSDPILPHDKILSPVFKPGRPEHFAIAGRIDINGDGRSDLKLVKSLINNAGGIVDAVVDERGNRAGRITAATKFLILGDRPTENVKNAEILKNYSRIQKDAKEHGVKTIRVSTFLEYMGWEGRERTVDLGKRAGGGDSKSEKYFKKRPKRGEKGAF